MTRARYLLAVSVLFGGVLLSHGIQRPESRLAHKDASESPAGPPAFSRETARWMLADARRQLHDRIASGAVLRSPTSPYRIKGQPAQRTQSEQNSQQGASQQLEAIRSSAATVFLSIFPQPDSTPLHNGGPGGRDHLVVSAGQGSNLVTALNGVISRVFAAPISAAGQASTHTPEAYRIKIDVLAGSFDELERPSDSQMTAAELVDVGSQGIEVEVNGAGYYLLPSDLIYKRVAESAESQTAEDLLDRAMLSLGFDAGRWRSRDVRLRTFRTVSFVEDDSHSRALEVVRGFVKPGVLDCPALLVAARSAGDYLVRMQRSDGSFFYWYRPLLDQVDVTHYNIIRHAGTAISLFDLYGVTRDPRYLAAARRAMTFLRSRFRQIDRGQPSASLEGKEPEEGRHPSSIASRGPDGPKAGRRTNATQPQSTSEHPAALYVLDDDHKAKLGAGGLALLAVARELELDHKADSSEAIRLARGILAMQRTDGSFENDIEPNGDDSDAPPSLYYPGEAMLGLIQSYKLNRDSRLLEAARRGADYLVALQTRQRDLPPDAWLVQALESIYEITKEARYAEHAIDLAASMAASLYPGDGPEGYAGAVSPGIPRATPTASRCEGILAGYRVARATGDSRAERLLAAARAAAAFQLTQQFSPDNGFFLPNPARAAGGFHESLDSTQIRIDYVQHNISSLLGLAQISKP